MLKNFLLGRENTSIRDSYIWNLIASGVNASEAIVVLMIATRTVGIDDAGILSIAFTIANLMMTIGKYGMRNFQVTDTINEFSFDDYFGSRICTTVIMVLSTIIYLFSCMFFGNYSWYKAAIIFCVILIYAVESFEDVYVSELQHRQRLDIGAKIFSVRWMGTLIVWGVGLILLKETLISSVIALLFDIILLAWLLHIVMESFDELSISKRRYRWDRVKQLLLSCFSLFASGFLAYYITNASKYAIDICLNDEVQACYGFVSMPIFVIGLLNTIIYQPILVKMSIEWNEGEIHLFVKRLIKQVIIIVVISLVCILGAWLFGIPVLSLLYATDLTEYKFELIVLLIGGMWLAFAGFFNSVITIMRKQRILLYVYIIVAILALLLSNKMVIVYGVHGASVANMIWTLIESIIFGLVVVFNVKKERKNVYEV